MDWSEIVDNPYLADLPFKIEQDRFGNIVMSPASNRHALNQAAIAGLLLDHLTGGRSATECSVATPNGVKVPDVAWLSTGFLKEHGDATPFEVAPEVCVEVISPSNSRAELEEKRQLYFDAGAQEVWFCNDDGTMEFFTPAGDAANSLLAPSFPASIG